ncbi:MAG: translation initiation factor IF-3 [Planctomycetota bacterium]
MAKPLRLNDQIRISPVRLIDHEGAQRGVVSTAEAKTLARELGLDLVEISPTEHPPVCRIMDYGKYKYDQKKKQKQRTTHIAVSKEVRLRPKTDPHDRDIKIKRAVGFLQEGSKVQFTMLFKGRERAHQDMGLEVFREIVAGLGDEVRIERPPHLEGRRLTMVLAPVKAGKAPKPPKPSTAPKPQTRPEVPVASAPVMAAGSDHRPAVETPSVPVASS